MGETSVSDAGTIFKRKMALARENIRQYATAVSKTSNRQRLDQF